MRQVRLSLDKEELPIQYGVTAGSVVEQFYYHAADVVGIVAATAPPDAHSIEVETEFEGVFFTHHAFSPTTALGKDTEWLADKTADWVEVRDATAQQTERCVVLRQSDGMFFAACSNEDFMTMLILYQTPG